MNKLFFTVYTVHNVLKLIILNEYYKSKPYAQADRHTTHAHILRHTYKRAYPPPPFIPKLNKSPLPSQAFTSTHLLEILSLPFPYDQIIYIF